MLKMLNMLKTRYPALQLSLVIWASDVLNPVILVILVILVIPRILANSVNPVPYCHCCYCFGD